MDPEMVVWAYRLLLGREPEDEATVERWARNLDRASLLAGMMNSPEFRAINPMLARNPKAWVWADVGRFVLRVHLADMHVSANVIAGQFEPRETRFVRNHLKPGGVALDIGANLGYYTLMFAEAVGEHGCVYSFEPMPELFDSLQQSVAKNDLQDRVTAFKVALSERAAEVELCFAPGSPNWGGAFVMGPNETVPAGHEVQKVPAHALDEILDLPRCDFIKIDVEGAEPLVIAGAAEALTRTHPIILSEIHTSQLERVSGKTAADYIRSLRDLGYRCHSLAEDGNPGQPLDSIEAGAIANVCFMPV
jgi:FkbM family methyltransferase